MTEEAGFLDNELQYFDRYINIRHRTVHAGCSGYLKSDPDYVLFLVPESEGDGLTVEMIPIQEMTASHQYAVRLEKHLRQKADNHYGFRE